MSSNAAPPTAPIAPLPPAQPTPPTPKQKRIELIEAIQKERGSTVITYVTSTRQNLEIQMAMDSIRKIYDHLQSIKVAKKDAKVDLFLHSNGGDGTVPWRLVIPHADPPSTKRKQQATGH